MNRILIILFFSLAATGCRDDRPGEVLPDAKMRSVLYDLLRADELTAQYVMRDSSWAALDKRAPLYQQVFQTHGVTKEQFRKSLDYYETKPAKMKALIESLSVQVEELQRNGDSSVITPPRQRDSTKRKSRPAVAL